VGSNNSYKPIKKPASNHQGAAANLSAQPLTQQRRSALFGAAIRRRRRRWFSWWRRGGGAEEDVNISPYVIFLKNDMGILHKPIYVMKRVYIFLAAVPLTAIASHAHANVL